MNFQKVTLALIVLFSGVSVAISEVTENDIRQALDKNKFVHPYLYFSEEDKPEILERIKTDPEAHDIMARLLAEANRFLYTPIEEDIPVEQKHPRYWSDGKHDSFVSKCRRGSETLAFVYQMTGEQKYADKAFEFLDALCDMQLWCYRAHEFPIIYSRVWPWNVDDDQVVFNYDIRTGDMARELGLVYDWLYPALDKHQRNRIRGALLAKAITLVRGNWDYHWWASSYRCNWCGIGLSGLGVASLALLNEDPELVDVIAESYNRMGRMFDELGVDGGWQEGRSYWAYGMRSCIFFMDSLNRLTNKKFNLFEHPRVAHNPASFALYGFTGYFGDGSGGVVGSPHLLNKMIDETKDGEAAWYRNNMLSAGNDIFDILWPRSDVKPKEPVQKSKHFRTIDWVVMRSDFENPETVTIATKAGWNDDPHHGHLDCGQIILNWQDQAFLMDLGSGRYFYDEKYFDEARWTYPQASSAGHNLVFVNGELQISAKYKDEPWQEGIGGKVLEFRPGKDHDYTLMDPTHAYPNKELKGWRRHIILEKPVITVILDEVKSARGAEIETRFHSECGTDMKERYALLKGKNGTMALIPVVDEDFTLRPGKHPYLPVRKDASFQWIQYFGTVLHAQNEITNVVTIILSVTDDNEAEKIAASAQKSVDNSGNLMLSFKKDSSTYRYVFDKQKDGLVLKK
ncbi:MAG: heparinase II/III family protein [Candidatus Latescibacteria bacterium]|nr:heparinase II/III family protein [Candidatus Latescibacterota bacterium]